MSATTGDGWSVVWARPGLHRSTLHFTDVAPPAGVASSSEEVGERQLVGLRRREAVVAGRATPTDRGWDDGRRSAVAARRVLRSESVLPAATRSRSVVRLSPAR